MILLISYLKSYYSIMKITFQTEILTHIAELSEDCTTEEIMEKCALLAEAAS